METQKTYSLEASNPFSYGLEIPAIVQRTKTNTVSVEDSEINDSVLIAKNGVHTSFEAKGGYLREAAEGTMVFRRDNVSEAILALDGCCLKMFSYIIMHLSRNSDRIRLDKQEYCEAVDCCEKTFYRAISLLIRYSVIAKYRKEMFWINPAILFNGSRIKKYPHNVVIKSINNVGKAASE